LFCNLFEIFSLIEIVLRIELIFENEKDSKKNCFQILIVIIEDNTSNLKLKNIVLIRDTKDLKPKIIILIRNARNLELESIVLIKNAKNLILVSIVLIK
jgi:hypothetical protein